jgi:hypothetical protein
MAMHGKTESPDFNFLKNEFPVEKWLEFAHKIINDNDMTVAA